jgi:hypothetical protein
MIHDARRKRVAVFHGLSVLLYCELAHRLAGLELRIGSDQLYLELLCAMGLDIGQLLA